MTKAPPKPLCSGRTVWSCCYHPHPPIACGGGQNRGNLLGPALGLPDSFCSLPEESSNKAAQRQDTGSFQPSLTAMLEACLWPDLLRSDPCLAQSSATDQCWNKSCQGSGESSGAAGVSTALASLMLRRIDQRCSPSAQLLPFRAPHPVPPHPEQEDLQCGLLGPLLFTSHLFINQHSLPAAAFPEA